jgi:hypothetical protein
LNYQKLYAFAEMISPFWKTPYAPVLPFFRKRRQCFGQAAYADTEASPPYTLGEETEVKQRGARAFLMRTNAKPSYIIAKKIRISVRKQFSKTIINCFFSFVKAF